MTAIALAIQKTKFKDIISKLMNEIKDELKRNRITEIVKELEAKSQSLSGTNKGKEAAKKPADVKKAAPAANKTASKKPEPKKGGAVRSASKGPVKKKPAAAPKKTQKSQKAQKPVKRFEPKLEQPIEEEDALQEAATYFSSEINNLFKSTKWQEKKEAMEQMIKVLNVEVLDKDTKIKPIAIMHLLNTKPGFKDTNFNTIKIRFNVVKILAEFEMFGTASLKICLDSLVLKLGDLKTKNESGEALYNIAEFCSTFDWLRCGLGLFF